MPVDEPKAEFLKYHFLKSVEDDEEVFPSVARIPDAMLKKIDPLNPVLVAYLKTINPTIETEVLFPRSDEGSLKQYMKSKKEIEPSPSKFVTKKKTAMSPKKTSGDEVKEPNKVQKQIEVTQTSPSKELVPSNSGVLKQLKKLAHKSKSSSEEHSPLVQKAQLNWMGVIVRGIPPPVSPKSKKRRAEGVAKHIAEKQKKRNLII